MKSKQQRLGVEAWEQGYQNVGLSLCCVSHCVSLDLIPGIAEHNCLRRDKEILRGCHKYGAPHCGRERGYQVAEYGRDITVLVY